MKLLILIDSLTCGGAEKSLITLLPFLVERGYDITLMLRARGGLFEQYVPKEICIIDFPYKPAKNNRIGYSLAIRLPWNRKRHTAEIYWQCIGRHFPNLNEKYDVAIAYQQGFPTFYVATKVRADKKFCWVNADIKSVGYSAIFCKEFYDRMDRICGVSDVLCDSIIYQKYVADRSKITTVLDIQNEDMIRKLAAERNPFDGGRFDIVTVGRLVPLKGYDLAIEAAKILRAKGVDFVWHFVGGGGLRPALEARISSEGLGKNVILEGEQLNPYPYIANCDIYVQTSKFEGFGLTIGEAKILGKPIVSTNFPVIYNQITPGENGFVVEMNGNAIAEGIMRLMDDVPLREKIVANVKAEHNTTAETESAKVIKLIEE